MSILDVEYGLFGLNNVGIEFRSEKKGQQRRDDLKKWNTWQVSVVGPTIGMTDFFKAPLNPGQNPSAPATGKPLVEGKPTPPAGVPPAKSG